jgi:hypothetical protein
MIFVLKTPTSITHVRQGGPVLQGTDAVSIGTLTPHTID